MVKIRSYYEKKEKFCPSELEQWADAFFIMKKFICENDWCFHNLDNVISDEIPDRFTSKVHIYYTYLILNESFSSNIFLSTLNIE